MHFNELETEKNAFFYLKKKKKKNFFKLYETRINAFLKNAPKRLSLKRIGAQT